MNWATAIIMPVFLVGGLAVLAHLPERHPVGRVVRETLDHHGPIAVSAPAAPVLETGIVKPAPPPEPALAVTQLAVPVRGPAPAADLPKRQPCERFLAMSQGELVAGLQCTGSDGRRVVVGLVDPAP